MKKCKICGKKKPLTEYYARTARCKHCHNEMSKLRNPEIYKAYYAKNKEKFKTNAKNFQKQFEDGFHTVYYIPEHHYVGVTKNLYNRLSTHKSRSNRIIDNVEIIYKTPCRKKAELVESKLHSMGYQG